MGATDGLAEAIRSALEARGVSRGTTRIEPILNRGGFVNRSFRSGTEAAVYCLKLTSDIDALRGLRQWESLHPLLEERYHAPRMLEWIEIEKAGSEPEYGPVVRAANEREHELAVAQHGALRGVRPAPG